MSDTKTSGFLIDYIINYCMLCDGKVEPNQLGDEYVKIMHETIGFMDEIPGGFLIYRADGDEEIIYANEALIKMFRCNSLKQFKEHTGNSFRGVVYRDDLDAVEASIAQQIADNQDKLDYVEYRILRRDGEVHWVDDYGHFIHTDLAGDIFYVFISDITDEKKREYDKERKLMRQEQLRRLDVIEALSKNYDSILYVDLDAGSVLSYRRSERISEFFPQNEISYNYDALLSKYLQQWVVPEDRQSVEDVLRANHMAEKLSLSDTYYLNYRVTENDRTVYMQLRVVNVGDGNRVSQAVIGTRNIDEEIEHERKQTQVLEAALRDSQLANAAKNIFLSNMSHDMRTPLNAIFGYASLAKNTADAAVKDYLDKIETSGKQLLELIEKVLFITQIESDNEGLSMEKNSLKALMNDVYNETCAKSVRKSISVSLDCSNVSRDIVVCDGEKLKQLLSYITGNAVKYTPKGGKVEISVIEKKRLPNGCSEYEFGVKDNGVGISRDNLTVIFEPFVRERNTTASGVIGAGLGLTIAKRLAEEMGGSINAESVLGEGSVFTVRLNLQAASENEDAEANVAVLTDKLHGKKILVVDDNEINLEILTEILRDLGFSVETAADGDVAVSMIAHAAPDEYGVVLMDIQMPTMDGREATKLIRAMEGDVASIPIIALSANAFDSDRKLSLASGMDAHLNKPIDLHLLVKTMIAVIQSR